MFWVEINYMASLLLSVDTFQANMFSFIVTGNSDIVLVWLPHELEFVWETENQSNVSLWLRFDSGWNMKWIVLWLVVHSYGLVLRQLFWRDPAG